jgi:hypothetical protein
MQPKAREVKNQSAMACNAASFYMNLDMMGIQ